MSNPCLKLSKQVIFQIMFAMPKQVSTILFLLGMALFSVRAQNITVLHTFTNTPDGAQPYLGGGLVLSGNVLYGTTLK
jgi:hypothetical protein